MDNEFRDLTIRRIDDGRLVLAFTIFDKKTGQDVTREAAEALFDKDQYKGAPGLADFEDRRLYEATDGVWFRGGVVSESGPYVIECIDSEVPASANAPTRLPSLTGRLVETGVLDQQEADRMRQQICSSELVTPRLFANRTQSQSPEAGASAAPGKKG